MAEKFSWRKPLSSLWVRGIFLILTISIFTTPAAPALPGPVAPPAPPAPVASPETKAVNVDRQVLEEVLNRALARQLAPITEMLTEMTIHKTSLPDILGGLGYILGIFGLWAYFLSKRKKIS